MKTIAATMLVSLVLLVSGCSQKVNDPADVQAIKKSVQNFVIGYNSRHANTVGSIMADNVAFAMGNSPAVDGKEAVQKLLKGVFDQLEQFNMEFGATVDDVLVSGDLGVARGTFTRKLMHKSGLVATNNDSGDYTAVFQRQGDGSWKCVSDIGTSNQLLPGTTVDGADEKALSQIEQGMAAAFIKGDTGALDRVMVKEWSWSNDGQLQSRAQVYGDLKTAYKLSSLVMRDLSPHVFGDFAIVSMIGEMKGTYKGKDVSGTVRSVDFFVKRDGRWQAVYSQNNTIKS
jgi:ketosteroid isomerase-like protein